MQSDPDSEAVARAYESPERRLDSTTSKNFRRSSCRIGAPRLLRRGGSGRRRQQLVIDEDSRKFLLRNIKLQREGQKEIILVKVLQKNTCRAKMKLVCFIYIIGERFSAANIVFAQ